TRSPWSPTEGAIGGPGDRSDGSPSTMSPDPPSGSLPAPTDRASSRPGAPVARSGDGRSARVRSSPRSERGRELKRKGTSRFSVRTGRSTTGSTSTGTGEAEAGKAGTVLALDVGFIKEAGYTGTGPRVALYGDSLTVAATPLLRKMFEDLSVRIVAMNGEGYDGGPWTNYLKSEGALVTE